MQTLARHMVVSTVALAVGFSLLLVGASGGLARAEAAGPQMSQFTLANGMDVVVIPDHRAPVVTHMVWYRVGAADDPQGKSGLAHFLEHLMFKETAKLKSGEFTRAVTRLGGRHNALTNHDTTSYFQRVAKQHLGAVMALEADRMRNLKLNERDVLTERDVIREERRANVEGSPIAALNEQMLAQLYQNHPYRRPVLGWAHEMSALTLEDAARFYAQHYAPNNAVLVVAGDITQSDVKRLADATYGAVERNPAVRDRGRPTEPEHISPRSLLLEDQRAGATPLMLLYYHVPSQRSLPPGDAEALQLLVRILGGDDTSRLYRQFVGEAKIALQAGADYQSGGRDSGRITLLALASPGVSTDKLEAAFDEVIAHVIAQGVSEEELQSARHGQEADLVYEADNVEGRARRIGEAITNGRQLGDIEATPRRLAAVTTADVQRVAREHLVRVRSVTGVLQRPSRNDARVSNSKPASK